MMNVQQDDEFTKREQSRENPSDGDSLVTAFNEILAAFYDGPGAMYPRRQDIEPIIARILQRLYFETYAKGMRDWTKATFDLKPFILDPKK